METYTHLYMRHTHAHIPVYQDQPVQETFGQLLDTSPSLPHVPLYVYVREGREEEGGQCNLFRYFIPTPYLVMKEVTNGLVVPCA